jgi:hypothetical protein
MRLLHLAADECAGFSADDLVAKERDDRRQTRALAQAMSMLSPNLSAK